MTPTKLASIIRYHLSELKTGNAHHEFEHLCRHLARARIYSNILPATGPVGAGGDAGRDFETFITAVHPPLAAISSFSDRASGQRGVAFACSLQKRTAAKIKSDVQAILAGGAVDEIAYFCESNLPVPKRHALQRWAKSAGSVDLQIFDGTAIAELLSERNVFWIAQEYLHLPAEYMPPEVDNSDWYAPHLERWTSREPLPVSNADFVEIKSGLRRATFHDDARPRLLFWIGLMERFLGPSTPRQLQRSALYELAVACLRGKGDLNSQTDRVRDYFSDIEQWLTIADLEDASNLTIYAFGAQALGLFSIETAELFEWRRRVANQVSHQITMAPGPGRRSGLLRIRGVLATLPETPGGPGMVDRSFDDWNLMLDEAEATPLFPIEDFSDSLSKMTPHLGQHPRFIDLANRVDALVAKRSGPATAAAKTFARATAFYEQDQLLDAIRDLHGVQLRWFTGDAMPRFQGAAYLLAKCYLELGLAYAAKNVALAAAYIAQHADDRAVAHSLPQMLLVAADADDGAGNSLSYLQMMFVAIAMHFRFDPDPLDSDKHPEIHANFGQIAALRGLAMRAGSPHVAIIDEALNLVPESIRLPIIQASQDLSGFWCAGSWDDAWHTLEQHFIDRPFGDLGPLRDVSWRALGIRWHAVFDNTYPVTVLAEEFIAELQIALAALARLDLCLLPTEIRLNLTVSRRGERLKAVGRKPPVGMTGVSFDIKLPAAAKPFEPGDRASATLALLVGILRSCSTLQETDFLDLLKDRLLLAASRVILGRPYRELYREFVPAELFREDRRRSLMPLAAERPFNQRQHELLGAIDGAGPTYSSKVAAENIRKRYETGEKCVGITTQHLIAHPEKRAHLTRFHEEGMRDWEILCVIANAATNLRHRLDKAKKPSKDDIERFRAALETTERAADALAPELFADELLEANRKMFQIAFLRGWGLYAPPAANDEKALETFLIQRYGLRSDDVEHSDLFHWSDLEQRNSAISQIIN